MRAFPLPISIRPLRTRAADLGSRPRPAAWRWLGLLGLLGLIAALVTVSTPAAALAQFNSTVRGRVTDASGEPLEGVKITIAVIMQDPTRPREPIETESGDDGNYFARNVPIERVNIMYEKEDFETLTIERELRPGPNRIDVTLETKEVPAAVRRAEAANEAYTAGLAAFQAREFDEAIQRMREARAAIEQLGTPEENREALGAIAAVVGRSYYEKRDYQNAITEFQRWAELAPDDANPHLELAQAHSMVGDQEASAAEFQKALELDPDDPMTHYNVGVTMINAAQVEEGIAELEKALELQPVYPLAHKNLGYGYARIEQYQKAIEHFEKYLEQEPTAGDRAEIEQFIAALREMIGG